MAPSDDPITIKWHASGRGPHGRADATLEARVKWVESNEKFIPLAGDICAGTTRSALRPIVIERAGHG